MYIFRSNLLLNNNGVFSIIIMLGNIYYLIGLVVLILSISNIYGFYKINDIKSWIRSFKKISGTDPGPNEFRNPKDFKLLSSYSLSITIEFIWLVLGILTNSWYIYLGLIVSSYIYNGILSRITIDTIQKNLGLLFFIFKSLIILILIINHFHLHINWVDLI